MGSPTLVDVLLSPGRLAVDQSRLLAQHGRRDLGLSAAAHTQRQAPHNTMSATPTFFPDAAAFRAWLAMHGQSAPELLVGFVKAHTGKAGLTWSQAVDEALCFGWIDGVRTRIDDDHYKIRFTPRRPTSHWSAANIKRVPELQASGRMTPPGLDAFALRTEARSATASYEQDEFPELSSTEIAHFKQNARAWAFYEKLPPSYRRKVNWVVISAKRPAT